MDTNGKILFEEAQLFRVKWLWILIILCVVSSTAITVGVAVLEKEKPREAMVALALVVPLEAIILYLFYITKLETAITSEGIYYRWTPFQRKGRFIPKGEIETAELRDGPVMSYGCHWIPGYGRVNNTGPGKGIQFKLRNGKKIFLGTQIPASLQTALEKIVTVMQKVLK
jgi:hypothetical protein